MRRLLGAVLVMAVGFQVPAEAQRPGPVGEAPRFPFVIESKEDSRAPTWVAAETLLDVFGKLQRDRIPHAISETIRGKEDLIDEINDFGNLAPAGGMPCTVDRAVRGTTWGEPDVPRSLDELLRRSRFAVSGKVLRTIDGFWRGDPATMTTIAVAEVFKQDQIEEMPQFLNVPIFAGEIVLGSARICTSRRGWPASPTIGDEVFLFPIRTLGPENTLAIDPEGYEIVFSSDGTLVFPGYLGSYLDLAEFETRVRTDPNALSATLRAIGTRR